MDQIPVAKIEERMGAILNIVNSPYRALIVKLLTEEPTSTKQLGSRITETTAEMCPFPRSSSYLVRTCKDLAEITRWVTVVQDGTEEFFRKTPDGTKYGNPAISYSWVFENEYAISLRSFLGKSMKPQDNVPTGPTVRVRLLELLGRDQGSLAQIERDSGIPAHTSCKHIASLRENGLVNRVARGKFELSPLTKTAFLKEYLPKIRRILEEGTPDPHTTLIERGGAEYLRPLIIRSIELYQSVSPMQNSDKVREVEGKILQYLFMHPKSRHTQIAEAIGMRDIQDSLRRMALSRKLRMTGKPRPGYEYTVEI